MVLLMTSIYNNFSLNFNNFKQIAFRSNSQSSIPFTSANNGITDSFTSNPLTKSNGIEQLEAEAKANPRIKSLLNEHNLPVKINETAYREIKPHLLSTRILAANIYSGLPRELKEQINLQDLQDAAMFHDYGKVLIPDNVLNKHGKLNDEEWDIMKLHSELGYELIKNKNISNHAMNLIKYHHQGPEGNGYPQIDKDFDYGIDSQILTVADKYNALVEARSYKEAMSKEDALGIIAKDVENGTISQEVFDALQKAV